MSFVTWSIKVSLNLSTCRFNVGGMEWIKYSVHMYIEECWSGGWTRNASDVPVSCRLTENGPPLSKPIKWFWFFRTCDGVKMTVSFLIINTKCLTRDRGFHVFNHKSFHIRPTEWPSLNGWSWYQFSDAFTIDRDTQITFCAIFDQCFNINFNRISFW